MATVFRGDCRLIEGEELLSEEEELLSEGEELLSEGEAREETVMLGLRTARGVAEGLLNTANATEMLADGRLEHLPGGYIRIPEKYWFISDDIIADLL
jgi:hypothetical protein